MTSVEWFVVLLVAGLMLTGAEIFVPGGILGTLGGLALAGAIAAGYAAFGTVGGSYAAGAIVVLVGVAIWLWVLIFPRTRLGRRMTVSEDLGNAKAVPDGLAALAGLEGEAVSELRPAGYALLDGRRVDVVTEGGMVARGTRVRVVAVESNRVVVAPIAAPPAAG